jgi:hypothetical protein
MNTSYLIFYIAFILFLLFYIRMRINYSKRTSKKFIIIATLQEIRDDYKFMKNEKDAELKRFYKNKIFGGIIMLLILIGLFILLLTAPVY